MAEEKKTTKSVPKSAPKKEKKEEIKIEKKFCTKCGKEILNNEECTCETKTEPISINKDAIASIGKGFLDLILNMFKKPSTTLDQEVEKRDISNNMFMLAIIAISFGLYITAGFTSIMSMFSGSSSISLSHYIDIPYFKIFLYTSIMYFALSFIPAIAAYLVARLTKNNDFYLKKSISLYITCMIPTIITNLLMAILYYLNILTFIGALIGAIVSLVCFFNYILGFIRYTDITNDKKPYALSGLIIIWVVTYIIAIVIFAGSIATDMTKDIGIKSDYNYNDYFRW